jgi:hypothetical protein
MGIDLSTNGYSRGYWNRMYQGISRANDVLDHLEAGTGTLSAAVKDQVEGQAKFLRGYFYHELLWRFGEVPVTTHVLTIEEGKTIARSTRDQVFQQAVSDLTAAAAKLPNTWPAASRGRATKGTALAYLARLNLYEASYQKYAANNAGKATPLFQAAADAAKQVMDLGVYSLYTAGGTSAAFRNLFTYTGENNAEIILAYQRVKGSNGWSGFRHFGPVSLGGTTEGNTPTRQLVDMFYMKDGLCPAQHSTTRLGCPLAVSPLYVADPVKMYENRDPRFYGTVLYPMGTFNAVTYNSLPSSTTADKVDTGNFYNTHTGYLFIKYVDPSDQNDNTNSGIDNILMRYADVLLMYAEAKIELNQFDAAVAAASIDKVRDRVGMPHVVPGAQADMIKLIRNERAVEFANEGLRMADIRRWRIAKQIMPGRVYGIDFLEGGVVKTAASADNRLFDDKHYFFPIPQDDINLNANLTQNPGF